MVLRGAPMRALAAGKAGKGGDPSGHWRIQPKSRGGLAEVSRGGLARASSREGHETDPFRALGIPPSATFAEAKSAFREKIKLVHPDVQLGDGTIANEEAAKLIEAYQAVSDLFKSTEGPREAVGDKCVFQHPTGAPDYIFVNSAYCRGAGCPTLSCCVQTAPNAFSFDAKTSKAKLREGAMLSGVYGVSGDSDYLLELAQGQCPANCLHWLSADQRDICQGMVDNMAEVRDLASRQMIQDDIDALIARANFENNRYRG